MKYTVRFAHMKDAPKWKVGDVIKRGDVIGTMGTTGKSTAAHLHIDCVEGEIKYPFMLADMTRGKPKPDRNQLRFFIDDELFGVTPEVTTGYNDPEYFAMFGKWHPAYDVVPEDRERWINKIKQGTKAHYNMHWNRSYPGVVSLIVYEPKGYGNCIYITFDTEAKT